MKTFKEYLTGEDRKYPDVILVTWTAEENYLQHGRVFIHTTEDKYVFSRYFKNEVLIKTPNQYPEWTYKDIVKSYKKDTIEYMTYKEYEEWLVIENI